jgi:hypothetical protein
MMGYADLALQVVPARQRGFVRPVPALQEAAF